MITEKNKKFQDVSLHELLNKTLPDLSILKEDDKKFRVKEIWENTPKENHLVMNKILTGTFRIGVSIGLITKSIAKLINLDEAIISHRLMGEFIPSQESYKLLIDKNINPSELNYKPYPFLLANTFEKKIVDKSCLLYTSPSPRDKRQSRMPSSA